MTLNLDWSVWVALSAGLVLAGLLWRSHRNYKALPEIPKLKGAPKGRNQLPDCMVVIPARNEEGVIGDAVRSLPPDTVIVVDDFSEDNTAREAREAGAGVLSAPEPIEGALGKSNACMEGARVLTSRWILFADADARFEAGFLNAAVGAAEGGQIEFLSVYLRPEYQSLKESAMSPYGIALYFCGIDPRSDPGSAFNGQCLLVKRSPYEFVGGHKALLSYVCEDVKLAALAQRHRLKFAVARAPDWGRVRIDPDDFERNSGRFTRVSLWMGARIACLAAAWALWFPILILLLVRHQFFGAMVWTFLPSVFLGTWYGWARAILAPVGIYAILPRLIRGGLGAITNRDVTWKGRVI